MIAFRFSKTDGGEYLSHLDLLRHIDRTLRRAGIKVEYSLGFHKHPRIFLGNPLGIGIKSLAEYCTVDTPFTGDFKEAFNSHSPKGIKCLDWEYVATNPNFANGITRCLYSMKGVAHFDCNEILACDTIMLSDFRGNVKNIRPRLFALYFENDTLFFETGCGESNLRPDVLCEYLCEKYGGEAREIIKISCCGEGVF